MSTYWVIRLDEDDWGTCYVQRTCPCNDGGPGLDSYSAIGRHNAMRFTRLQDARSTKACLDAFWLRLFGYKFQGKVMRVGPKA